MSGTINTYLFLTIRFQIDTNIVLRYSERNQSFGQIKHVGQDPTTEGSPRNSHGITILFTKLESLVHIKHFLPLSVNLLLWARSFSLLLDKTSGSIHSFIVSFTQKNNLIPLVKMSTYYNNQNLKLHRKVKHLLFPFWAISGWEAWSGNEGRCFLLLLLAPFLNCVTQ